MNDLVTNLGSLVALKRLNRDKLAAALGISRPNMISALRGRRSLPPSTLPILRALLHLDDAYMLTCGRVHVLSVRSVAKDGEIAAHVLHSFLVGPMQQTWTLKSVGENGYEGFACVFQDARGAMVVVRNDDALLPQSLPAELWLRNSQSRDVHRDYFALLMAEDISPDLLGKTLHSLIQVWTWNKLRMTAELSGITPEDVMACLRRDALLAQKIVDLPIPPPSPS